MTIKEKSEIIGKTLCQYLNGRMIGKYVIDAKWGIDCDILMVIIRQRPCDGKHLSHNMSFAEIDLFDMEKLHAYCSRTSHEIKEALKHQADKPTFVEKPT